MNVKVKITRKENADFFGASVGEIITVPLEDYVAGVVASEIGNSAVEACKAQAVAARTFVYPYCQKDKAVSDSSAVAQAFRAPRMDRMLYPNARAGTEATAGQVLFYNGKVISTCSYSACNGGHTVSSEERWGGKRAWLISQPDPWDATTGKKKNGHGVGMSQVGIKYAASIGVAYADMLAFYYPGTALLPIADPDPPASEDDFPEEDYNDDTPAEASDPDAPAILLPIYTVTLHGIPEKAMQQLLIAYPDAVVKQE